MLNLNSMKQWHEKEKMSLDALNSTSLEEVAVGILTADCDRTRDSLLPCGITVDEAAKRICTASCTFTENRDQMLKDETPYTQENLLSLLGTKFASCSREEAFACLTNLHLIQKHMELGDLDTVTADILQKEYSQLQNQFKNTDLDTANEILLSSLDTSFGIDYVKSFDAILRELKNRKVLKEQAVSSISREFTSAELIAIRSAMMYRRVCDGHISNADPASDPGTITMEIATASDVALASQLRESGIISSDKADLIFRIIGVAVSLTVLILAIAALLVLASASLIAFFQLMLIAFTGGANFIACAIIALIPACIMGGCAYLSDKYADDFFDTIPEKIFEGCVNALHTVRKTIKNHQNTAKHKNSIKSTIPT